MFNDNLKAWAEFIFEKAELGDPGRTKRVIQLAGDLASNIGSSFVKASEDPASIQGAYRFSRIYMIKPEQIALAYFILTDSIVKQRPLVQAIQKPCVRLFCAHLTRQLLLLFRMFVVSLKNIGPFFHKPLGIWLFYYV